MGRYRTLPLANCRQLRYLFCFYGINCCEYKSRNKKSSENKVVCDIFNTSSTWLIIFLSKSMAKFLVFMWRHHFPKQKNINPCKVPVLSYACTWAPTWRLHTKLCKFGWNTFPHNARMNYRTDLNLGEVVYISNMLHLPVSWLNLLKGYDFFFDGVTLQTSNWKQANPLPYIGSVNQLV